MPMTEDQSLKYEALSRAARMIIAALDDDVTREGLKDTPDRFARAWLEFGSFDAGNTDAVFSVQSDDMVVATGINVWSVCEHHLLPFSCRIAVGYIPNGLVLGLSKLPRICQRHAHRLQIQERLVAQIADDVRISTPGVQDVAVVAVGTHLCAAMRGVRSEVQLTTSALRGRFKTDQAMRLEFMKLAKV